MTEIAYRCQLSQQEKEYAAANLNETDELRAEKIEELREWILSCHDFRSRTDDFFILRFLRACKFNTEKAKMKLRNYHRHRTEVPEWFANRDPLLPEMQEMFDLGVFLPLRKLDSEGRLVVLVRATVHDPRKHKQSDVLKASMMVIDVLIRNYEPVTLYGIIAVVDLQDVTLGHALQMTPNVIRKLVYAWQDCYPLRIRSIDFINAPTYVNVVIKIFKSFMTQKLKRRVHIHGRGTNTFNKKMSPDILPIEYGGTCGSIQHLKEHWKQVVQENRSWLAEDEKYQSIPVATNEQNCSA